MLRAASSLPIVFLSSVAFAAGVPVKDLVRQFPASEAMAAQETCARLLEGGKPTINEIIALLCEPGKAPDKDAAELNVKARYALHALAIHAARPGADPERKLLVETLLEALGTQKPAPIKGFLIRQLQLAAGQDAVGTIAQFLLGPRHMCEYAAQALVAIALGGKGIGATDRAVGPQAVADALRSALAKATGPNRLTIIQALGVVRDQKAVPALLKAAADDDRDVRLTALFALANIGDAGSGDILIKASGAESPYERAQATDALVRLARRLAQAGKKPEAEKIYRHLWTKRTEGNVRCAALRGLAAVLGDGAAELVIEAMKDKDPNVRVVAAELAAATKGEGMTRKLLESLKGAEPEARVGILRQLARRRDPVALPAVIEATSDPDKQVRTAAIAAAAAIGATKALPRLVELLGSDDRETREAASRAVVTMKAEGLDRRLVEAAKQSPPPIRARVLSVLAARGARDCLPAIVACLADPDTAVRCAALDATGVLDNGKCLPQVVERLVATASGAERSAAEKAAEAICKRGDRDRCAQTLLAALPKARGEARARGLDALKSALAAEDRAVREAAVRALARWPNVAVADQLLALAREAQEPKLRVIALQGYIRLVGLPSKRPRGETIRMYAAGLQVAERPEEKRAILSALGDSEEPAALKRILPLLRDKAVGAEAGAAIVRLADELRRTKDKATRMRLADALAQVSRGCPDERRRKDARRLLDRYYKKDLPK